jgi:hypothetical protein
MYFGQNRVKAMAEMIARNADELGDFWAKEVYPFVKPIIEADRKGRASPIGSGVLVSCHGKEYLLTAYHVTENACTHDEGGALYTFAPEQVEIMGVNNHVGDPFDLSMTALPPSSRRCLWLPRHLAFDIRQGELCLVLGFPGRSKSWDLDHSRHTLRPTPLSYLGTVFRSSPGRFSVRFSRKHTHRNGQRLQRIGKLNGVSGGGAFVLRDDRPRLAGIVIEYHSNSSEIVCTDSHAVWSMAKQL